ncbi:hypothetical protein [Amycolatopsis rhabdoformis]|uniref:hypothetical protein n=1 Tax=Amycolatopsis rhabdoformis TaxID=1448059 RepID=UPI003899628A
MSRISAARAVAVTVTAPTALTAPSTRVVEASGLATVLELATRPGARLVEARLITATKALTAIEPAANANDQAVLAAALATGPVTEFSHQRRTLAELFRDSVTQARTQGGKT